MWSVIPAGMVKTELFSILTFPGAVAVADMVQLVVMVQVPELGGVQVEVLLEFHWQ